MRSPVSVVSVPLPRNGIVLRPARTATTGAGLASVRRNRRGHRREALRRTRGGLFQRRVLPAERGRLAGGPDEDVGDAAGGRRFPGAAGTPGEDRCTLRGGRDGQRAVDVERTAVVDVLDLVG